MPLSDDQRAMLRLLAQREQGYEDMASLMGVSVEELRSRVKDALAELEREGEAPPDLPPAPAEKAEDEPEDPAAAEPPADPVPVPDKPAKAPKVAAVPPAEPTVSGKPAPPASPPRAGGSKFQLPKGKGARAGIGAVVAAIVVVVVLLIVLDGGGSDSGSTTSTTQTTAAAGGGEGKVAEIEAQAEKINGGKEATKAVLSGVGGSEAEGIAIFGRVKNALALQVVAEGLEPAPAGQAYGIWLAKSPTKMLPLAAVQTEKGGVIAGQFRIPTEILAYLANETFGQIAITLVDEKELGETLKTATSKGEPPAYTGTAVLRGPITGPFIGAAKKAEAKSGK